MTLALPGDTEQKEKDLGRIGFLGAFTSTRLSLEHDLKIVYFLITTKVLHFWSTTDDII